jgi:hypothetical protein
MVQDVEKWANEMHLALENWFKINQVIRECK